MCWVSILFIIHFIYNQYEVNKSHQLINQSIKNTIRRSINRFISASIRNNFDLKNWYPISIKLGAKSSFNLDVKWSNIFWTMTRIWWPLTSERILVKTVWQRKTHFTNCNMLYIICFVFFYIKFKIYNIFIYKFVFANINYNLFY